MLQVQLPGSRTQPLVICPQRHAPHEPGGGEQVNIDITETGPKQSMPFDQVQNFFVGGDRRLRQKFKFVQNGFP